MKPKFIGGPYDGQELSHDEINAVAFTHTVHTESGIKLFLLMPTLEECRRLLRGEIAKQEAGGDRYAYQRFFVGKGMVEFRDASAGGDLDGALAESSRSLSEEELEKKRQFGELADQFISQVHSHPLTGDTEFTLRCLCVDRNGIPVDATMDINTTTIVRVPGDKDAAKALAEGLHLDSIIGNINANVRNAPTGFVLSPDGQEYQIQGFRLEIR